MYSLEITREVVKENIMIVGVQDIESDFWGSELTLKGVTVSIQQGTLLFLKEVFANVDMVVDCSESYPVLIHKETKEVVIDYDHPISDDENELPMLLSYALIVYFHDHAKGQRQKTFLYGFEKTFKEAVNKGN